MLTRIFFSGGEKKALRLVKDSNGGFCTTPGASINLLMDSHFLGSIGHMTMTLVAHTLTEIEDPKVEFISPTRVRKAIWSFGDLKAAGPDELKPIVLKHLGEKVVNKLVDFFKASSLLGYIPFRWRESRAVFIPKPGKSYYSQVCSFRPILLSSFIIKAFERVWAWLLEESALIQNILRCDHHAFRHGCSTDSALSTMVEYAESAIIQNNFTLGVFPTIQGAFDNVSIDAVIRGMQDMNFPEFFINWYLLCIARFAVRQEGRY